MTRRIQRVPALYVSELHRLGLLPQAPDSVIASAHVDDRRDMTLAEAASVTWLLVGLLEKPCAVGAFRDTYDFQLSVDAREVVHLAGSRRGVVELIRFLIADARAAGRRCIGVTDKSNAKMCSMLARLGCEAVRVRWESR